MPYGIDVTSIVLINMQISIYLSIYLNQYLFHSLSLSLSLYIYIYIYGGNEFVMIGIYSNISLKIITPIVHLSEKL